MLEPTGRSQFCGAFFRFLPSGSCAGPYGTIDKLKFWLLIFFEPEFSLFSE